MISGGNCTPLKLDTRHGYDHANSRVRLGVPIEHCLIRGLQSGEEDLRQYECNLAQKKSARFKAFFCQLIHR
jgi:hypothetical protein